MKNVLFPFPRKDLRRGRSTHTRKPPRSTSNPAPSHARSRLFREVAVPRPEPTASCRPLRCTHASSCCWASEQSSLSLRQISTPSVHHPASGRGEVPAVPSFTVRPGALPAPSLDNSGAKTPDRARAGGVPGGRGGGAQARTVPGWAPGRPGSCLLLPQARGSRRANGCQPRPRGPNEWPGAPRFGATVPPSGSSGRLRLVRGRVSVRAFALRRSGSCPCRCPHSSHPPTVWGRPGPRSRPGVQHGPRGPGRAGRRELRALSAGGTGRLCRGKLACRRWAPAGRCRLGRRDPPPFPKGPFGSA